jgi:putative peptide modification target (TIGR04139 family)
MKKVKGLKNNFSSLENKKLKNLTSIQGGKLPGSSTRTAASNAQGASDVDHYSDDSTGNWTYVGREIYTIGG